MLLTIPGLEDDVIGFEAKGEVRGRRGLGGHQNRPAPRSILRTDRCGHGHPVYRDSVKLFGHMMKAEVKVFGTAELATAKDWIAAGSE